MVMPKASMLGAVAASSMEIRLNSMNSFLAAVKNRLRSVLSMV